MDPFIEARLAVFAGLSVTEFRGLPPHERHRQFERFVNFHVFRRWFLPEFSMADVDHVSTGESDDNQIDGYGIIIDGRLAPRLATDDQSVTAALNLLEAAENDAPITYVFIQSTTSGGFVRQKMLTMVAGANNSIAEEVYATENAALATKRQIKSAIAASIGGIATQRVSISLFYVALGTWKSDGDEHPATGTAADRSNREAFPLGWRREAENSVRRMTGCVNAPNVEVIDLARLKEIIAYNEQADAERPVPAVADPPPLPRVNIRTISAPHLLPMPNVDGVTKGFIGYVSADEFLNLLEREDGQGMIDAISFSNVRAFQGADNAVNAEIAATLAGERRSEFLLLNNGVTIVSANAAWDNGRLTLDDYQIVNGLQTSTILYRQRSALEGGALVHVPLKVVVTSDKHLLERVVRATNRQTAITDLQQESLSAFVLKLWRAFEATHAAPALEPLWLERRRGEFDEVSPHADGNRIMTLEDVLAVVTSTYLRQPYVASSGVAAMRSKVPYQIFHEDHRPYPYLVAARLLFQVRSWLARNDQSGLDRFQNYLCFGLYTLAFDAPLDLGFDEAQCELELGELDRRIAKADAAAAALAIVANAINEIIAPLRRQSHLRKWRDAVRTKGLLTTPLERRLAGQRQLVDWR